MDCVWREDFLLFLLLLVLSSVNTCGRQLAGAAWKAQAEPVGEAHWGLLGCFAAKQQPEAPAADATAHRGPGDGGGGQRCSRKSAGFPVCACSPRA